MLGHRQIGERVLELLGEIDVREPRVDQGRISDRLQAYLEALELPPADVRFASDLRALRVSRTWPQTDRGAWPAFSTRQAMLLDAGMGSRWQRLPVRSASSRSELASLLRADRTVLELGLGDSRYVRSIRRVTTGLDRIARVLTWRTTMLPPRRVHALVPLAEAAAAGLFTLSVGEGYAGDLVALVRPRMRFDAEGRFHHWDGRPAAEWPNGKGLYFWHGVEMTESVGCRPDAVTPSQVLGWANAERRRVAIERVGLDRFMQALGGVVVQEDDYGRLWRTERDVDGEPLVAIEVVNATREPDGSFKRYFLRVPPSIRSARRGVAWSFGLTRKAYAPAVET